MQVNQIVNTVFTSNTYIISNPSYKWVWLIDIGDFDGVMNVLSKDTMVRGVFITHPHYDHIYGINKLIDYYPSCVVYASSDTKKALYSDKLNLSFYHDASIIYTGSNVQLICEGDTIELYNNSIIEILETPGHNWGCLTFKTENYLFTGDSFIPNFEVVTKLKGGSKEANINSLQKIMQTITNDTIVCPGHGEMTKFMKHT